MAHASEAEESTAAEAVSADEELARALQREELHLRPRPRRRPNAKPEDNDSRLDAALEAKEVPSRNLSNGNGNHKRQGPDETNGSRDSRHVKRHRGAAGRPASPATNGGSCSDDARSEPDGSAAERAPSTDGFPVDSVKTETWDAQEQGAMCGSRTPAAVDMAHCIISNELMMMEAAACCNGRCDTMGSACMRAVDANEEGLSAVCKQAGSSTSAAPRKAWNRGVVVDATCEPGEGQAGPCVRGELGAGESKRVKAVRLTTSTLRAMSTKDLQQVYFDSFGTETKAHNKDWIINKLTRSAADVAAGGALSSAAERDTKSFASSQNGDAKQLHIARSLTAAPLMKQANGVGVTAIGHGAPHQDKGLGGGFNGVRKCGGQVAEMGCRSQDGGVHMLVVPAEPNMEVNHGEAPPARTPLDVVCSKSHTSMGARMPPKLKWLAKFMEEDTSSDFIKISGQLVR